MEPSSLSPALSVPEVCTALGLSPLTVRRLIGAGTLPAFKPGGRRWRVRQADLEAYIAERLARSEAS